MFYNLRRIKKARQFQFYELVPHLDTIIMDTGWPIKSVFSLVDLQKRWLMTIMILGVEILFMSAIEYLRLFHCCSYFTQTELIEDSRASSKFIRW